MILTGGLLMFILPALLGTYRTHKIILARSLKKKRNTRTYIIIKFIPLWQITPINLGPCKNIQKFQKKVITRWKMYWIILNPAYRKIYKTISFSPKLLIRL